MQNLKVEKINIIKRVEQPWLANLPNLMLLVFSDMRLSSDRG